ncbi:monovalent cation/H+ antiporter subunit G [Litchfieldella qijiaojingensis]|uniref:Monovalent cation/H+ antiporter subunit G n=1 Tax=Litchfieldella qijiaojingensis TaxID=980347 RepID=A0ABQ2YKL4_9GAMM|nr:Na+/H+ antiporter subunit G [Halomonas qijiaojingensis]GGX85942.1 monovalent cation/H+ antiporter subunit G [Halomonas qijiaojingensis]
MNIPTWLDALIAAMLLIGAIVATLGSLGLARMPDFYMRLHGPTKASTLGVGCTMLGSLLYFSTSGEGIRVQEVLITVFLFVTAPVSAHVMAWAALHRRVHCSANTRHPPWPEMDRAPVTEHAASSAPAGDKESAD